MACIIREGFLDSDSWTGSLNLAMVDAEELQNNFQRLRAAMERTGKVADQIVGFVTLRVVGRG